MRNDFVKGQSDLDFAVILDVEEEVEHWIHPEFTHIANFTHELLTQLPTGYCRKESPDICSIRSH